MANDTKLTISIETILRGLDKTLRGLAEVEKKLKTVAAIQVGGKTVGSGFDKAAVAAQRLALQQQRLGVQATELANRQERARQQAERLAQANDRLAKSSERAAKASQQQADSHVKEFRAQQAEAQRRQTEVNRINQQTAAQAKQQATIQSRAAKGIADAQVKEAKRGADALIKSLNVQNAEVARAKASFVSFGNSLRSVGQAMTTFGFVLTAAVTAPLIQLGRSVVDAAVTMDSLRRGLTTIAGSSDEAAVQLARLTNIAKLPGIGFQEAIQGSIRLQAVGFSAKEAEKALVEFSNAIALTGGGREELARVTVQLGQLAAKGKVLSQDLRPIIEAAPEVGTALKKAFGTVNADDIAKLSGSSEEFLKILVKQLEALPRAAAGAKNSFENFSDIVFRAGASVGEALLPALIQLANIAGPIITGIANAFKILPVPLQSIVVAVVAVSAAFGPLLLITGPLVTGFGRLAVGLGGAAANMGLLGTVSVETAAAQAALAETEGILLASILATTNGIVLNTEALAALTAAATTAAEAEALIAAPALLGGGAILALVGIVTAVAIAFVSLSDAQKESLKVSEEQVNATRDQIASLENQLKFLDGLEVGVKRTADEQERLAGIYAILDDKAAVRVQSIGDETKELAALRVELERILKLRSQEQLQQAAATAASLINTINSAKANEQQRQSVADEISTNEKFAESQRALGNTSDVLIKKGITGNDVLTTFTDENERLLGVQADLGKTSVDLTAKIELQTKGLKILEAQGIGNLRQYLEQAKALGQLEGTVDDALAAIQEFAKGERAAVKDVDLLTLAMQVQKDALDETGKSASDISSAEARRIREAHLVAIRQTTDDKTAIKNFRAFMASSSQLTFDVKNQADEARQSVDEFITELFKKTEKSGTGIRNAQEAFAEATAQLLLANAENEITATKVKNNELLRLNEARFNRELISFHQFITKKAELEKADIQGEIKRQQDIADAAGARADRARTSAGKPGIPQAERTRDQTIGKKAEADKVQAETKILELKDQQAAVDDRTAQDFSDFNKTRLKDLRDLGREIDEITGKERQAAEGAVDERFRSLLKDLDAQISFADKLGIFTEENRVALEASIQLEAVALKAEQDSLKARIAASAAGSAGDQERLTLGQQLVDVVKKQTAAEEKLAKIRLVPSVEGANAQKDEVVAAKAILKANADVQASQAVIQRAQVEQANLEQELRFEVEFRGLSEDAATARRLEGERKLIPVLDAQRAILSQIGANLVKANFAVPLDLTNAIAQIDLLKKGLGELSLPEQFQRAEKEFGRIEDELADKIADVERKIRSRDIAEVQGKLIIRRLNGEYVGQLEKQLAVLQAIAAQDKDPGSALKRRAAEAAQTTKDTKAEANEVDNLNKQLKAVSVDALNDSLGQLFRDLADNTQSAAQDIANFFKNILSQVNDFVSRNLARQITESLFPDPNAPKQAGSFFGKIKGILGIGGDTAKAGTKAATDTAQATTAATAITTAGTTAGAALTTGATAASTALGAGGATAGAALATSGAAASATLAASITAAAAAFAATVIAAGAAFAAAVAAGAGAQALGGAGAALGSFGGAATGAIVPAQPMGKVVRVAEGGYDEAVLTTDPRHQQRQAAILREYLKETHGLWGRIPQLATGGIVSAADSEQSLLRSLQAGRLPSNAQPVSLGNVVPADNSSTVNLRNINLINKRDMVRGYMRSAEGTIDILNTISENAPEIGRRIGVR